ncbi:MAG TPA: DUF2817 domain-containing protein [Vicinamibacterales bacterium]|jgi:hypothetical protein
MVRRTSALILSVAASLLLLFGAAPSRAQSLQTPGEQSGYKKYSQFEDVTRFLDEVVKQSKQVQVQTIGQTGPAKDFPGARLFLVAITDEGAATPQALNRAKPTFMLIASQHGNEQSGKEASLALVRDIALGEMKPLLKQVNFLIVPQANPYGNFINRRTNEQGLDLNRDHVKLEAPETRIIHAAFRAWMPEVTLDVHEKGDDYYRVSTGCVSNANIHPTLERFSRDILFKQVEQAVTAAGYTWFEYLVTERVGSAGAAGAPEPRGNPSAPRETLTRPSTTDLNDGRNSLGIYETLSFIQEGSSRHDLDTLKDRTGWQYRGIRALMEATARNGQEVVRLVRGRREALARDAKTYAADKVVYLRMEYVKDPKQPELTIKRFDRSLDQRGATERAATEPAPAPVEQKVLTQVVKNWLPKVEPSVSVPRPLGYIIPAANRDVVDTLIAHGIEVACLTKSAQADVETYEIGDVVPASDDYVAPDAIAVTKKALRTTVAAGAFYVTTDQPAANLIPSLLEPQAGYGLIRYRSFKLPQQKGGVWPFTRVITAAALPLVPVR